MRCNAHGRDQALASRDGGSRRRPPIQPRRAARAAPLRAAAAQVGGYAPETRPTSRQHQLQRPKQAAPTLQRPVDLLVIKN